MATVRALLSELWALLGLLFLAALVVACLQPFVGWLTGALVVAAWCGGVAYGEWTTSRKERR